MEEQLRPRSTVGSMLLVGHTKQDRKIIRRVASFGIDEAKSVRSGGRATFLETPVAKRQTLWTGRATTRIDRHGRNLCRTQNNTRQSAFEIIIMDDDDDDDGLDARSQ